MDLGDLERLEDDLNHPSISQEELDKAKVIAKTHMISGEMTVKDTMSSVDDKLVCRIVEFESVSHMFVAQPHIPVIGNPEVKIVFVVPIFLN